MKSPITGKDMILMHEDRVLEFRKENIEVKYHYYRCEDSGEQFTTSSLDDLNINQLYNKYRCKFNIPFPDEIVQIRNKYGIPASTMSEILGFGVNTYRQYESGEIPSHANANLIKVAKNPKQFKSLVDSNSVISEKVRYKINKKIEQLIAKEMKYRGLTSVREYLFGAHHADIYTGYKTPNVDKLIQMVVFFAQKMKPFKTKMNKLLFYADFLKFKETTFSMSGMKYVAIDHGPVPNNYQSIFEYICNEGFIDVKSIDFSEGYQGNQFIPSERYEFDNSLFTSQEIDILNEVVARFENMSSREISDISHLELAWTHNVGNKDFISYEYAFEVV